MPCEPRCKAAFGTVVINTHYADDVLKGFGARGYNWKNEALLRHRFARKGRTLSASLSFALNSKTGGGNLYSVNKYYQGGGAARTDTLNQLYDLPGKGNSYGVNLAYTEPLSKRSLLEFSVGHSNTRNNSEKTTWDYNKQNGKYDQVNTPLTNDFENTYNYTNAGIRMRMTSRR